MRVLGCFLIGSMPLDGVEEAVTNLREIFEFHEENLRFVGPSRPLIKSGVGVIDSHSERTPLRL